MFTTNSGRFISYYGREHTLDIQRQDGNNPTIMLPCIFYIVMLILLLYYPAHSLGVTVSIKKEASSLFTHY